MYGILLFLHILAATIWTGGHIVLSVVILPKVLREKSPEQLLNFESAYKKIGMPALIVQVVTGMILVYQMLPKFSQWFIQGDPIAHLLIAKLSLLAATIAFAIDAKFRVLPVLSEKNLVAMAWHIIPVTILSILFVLVGVSFRAGWLN